MIAIHSTVLGPGLGGTAWPCESFDAAVTDCISRGMTYKAAAAGINLGAKAVIVGDPEGQVEALFRAFGRFDRHSGRALHLAKTSGRAPRHGGSPPRLPG
ncbi:MAG: Glu/Leu/Phe/Val dehydrogenase dimerization domain-containing protein [Thermoanaerobaculia bacterium]